MPRLKVTQTRGVVGGKAMHRETLRSLGLKRIGDTVVKEDRPGDPWDGPDGRPHGDRRGG